MSSIHLNSVQLLRRIGHKIEQRLMDIVLQLDLIAMCPCFNKYHRHTCVDQAEVGVNGVDYLKYITNHLVAAFVTGSELCNGMTK